MIGKQLALGVLFVSMAAVLLFMPVRQNIAYHNALALAEAGEYDEAISLFQRLTGRTGVGEQQTYTQALALLRHGEYTKAISKLEYLGEYQDSKVWLEKARKLAGE